MPQKLLICVLVALLVSVQAWVSPWHSCKVHPATSTRHVAILRSTPSDDDDEARASFDDAGRRLVEEENEEMAANMGRDEDDDEFENRSKEYDAIRDAIRERTAEIGIEKSVVTAKLIEEANARAAAGEAVTGLDLSQITGTLQQPLDAPVDDDENDDITKMNLPTLADDLEEKFKKLPEDQRKLIDPTDGMGWFEQSKEELKYIEWPTPLGALKEVALVALCVVVMAFLVINWDTFLRNTFTEYGMIPRPDEVTQQFEGLKLPEGWTEGLNEKDIADVPIGDVGVDVPSAVKEMSSSIPSDL